jgi:hypothetical protein
MRATQTGLGDCCPISYHRARLFARLRRCAASLRARLCPWAGSMKANGHQAQSGTRSSGNRLTGRGSVAMCSRTGSRRFQALYPQSHQPGSIANDSHSLYRIPRASVPGWHLRLLLTACSLIHLLSSHPAIVPGVFCLCPPGGPLCPIPPSVSLRRRSGQRSKARTAVTCNGPVRRRRGPAPQVQIPTQSGVSSVQ